MKKQAYAILATAALVIGTASAGIGLGDPMTRGDVEMKNVDGTTITLNTIKGDKGTLVIFSCNHCPFVKGWQDTMVEIGNTYQRQGIGVVFINPNDPAVKGDTYEGMQELAKAEGYEFPYVVDATSDVARSFGATKTPDVFLFDAAGKLIYQGAVGEGGRQPAERGEPYLKNALDALLAGKVIEKPQTKAVGCSIKFR